MLHNHVPIVCNQGNYNLPTNFKFYFGPFFGCMLFRRFIAVEYDLLQLMTESGFVCLKGWNDIAGKNAGMLQNSNKTEQSEKGGKAASIAMCGRRMTS